MKQLDFYILRDTAGNSWIETSLTGKLLLTTPQLNKSTAFTAEERKEFGLLGKLPSQIETLEIQVERAYLQFNSYSTDFQRHIYLNNLHDTNQVLFYKLVSEFLKEMLPLMYTPHIAVAVKEFSHQFRRVRGLYIDYPNRHYLDEILNNRSNPEIDLIVVTDGEAVLGIGDQGVGAIDIPIAKLMVYTLCGGINPTRTLPILLDVGTNNQTHLSDPLYLGWRQSRLSKEDYHQFITDFIQAVKRKFPRVLLHWEDVAYKNAIPNLQLCEKFEVCSFNDDIQGTGATTLATILAAIKVTHSKLADQKIIIFGAGTAGTGIADQIYKGLLLEGLTEEEAKNRFWLIDKNGLITSASSVITSGQERYKRAENETKNWNRSSKDEISLEETIRQIKPTILIGSSSVGGAFHESIIKEMSKHVTRPIILPLSNPTQNSEATPQDIYDWTDGKALIATGSPFPPVNFKGKNIPIAQCNNAFVFPGIGLGVVASKARKVSDSMLWAACKTLAEFSPIHKNEDAPLLPRLEDSRQVAKAIAKAVAVQAIKENLSDVDLNNIDQLILDEWWEPKYLKLKRK